MIPLMLISSFSLPLIVKATSYDYGTPTLDTEEIGLFCFWYKSDGWTLNYTISALHEYSNHGNYYDGIIRVFMRVDGSTFVSGSHYVDVNVRVRADGWVMTWLWESQDKKYIPFLYKVHQSDFVKINATVLSRAMQQIYYSSEGSLLDHEDVYYWDYTYTSTTSFIMVNYYIEEGTKYGAVITNIPDEITVSCAYVMLCLGGSVSTPSFLRINTVYLHESSSYLFYGSFNITSYFGSGTQQIFDAKAGTLINLNFVVMIWIE